METIKVVGMQKGEPREIFHHIPFPNEALSLLIKKLLTREDIDMVMLEQEIGEKNVIR